MTTTELKLTQRVGYFIGIGIVAALSHLFIVYQLVTALKFHPLLANAIAFLMMFSFSYFGHKRLTFATLPDEKQLSLPHFFLVASSAGILNELLYAVLLRYSSMNYLMALVLVLAIVAVYSFICSRYWACRQI